MHSNDCQTKFNYANTYRGFHDRDNFSYAVLWPISGVTMAGPHSAYAVTADDYCGYDCCQTMALPWLYRLLNCIILVDTWTSESIRTSFLEIEGKKQTSYQSISIRGDVGDISVMCNTNHRWVKMNPIVNCPMVPRKRSHRPIVHYCHDISSMWRSPNGRQNYYCHSLIGGSHWMYHIAIFPAKHKLPAVWSSAWVRQFLVRASVSQLSDWLLMISGFRCVMRMHDAKLAKIFWSRCVHRSVPISTCCLYPDRCADHRCQQIPSCCPVAMVQCDRAPAVDLSISSIRPASLICDFFPIQWATILDGIASMGYATGLLAVPNVVGLASINCCAAIDV